MRDFPFRLAATLGLGNRARRAVPVRVRFRPTVDLLEGRTLLSTFAVLNLNDSGAGSLRAAVTAANANPGSAIVFNSSLHGTITLTSGELLLASNVTIAGPGASRLAISAANYASRVFQIAAGQNVVLSGLTVTKGSAPDTGGGILNDGSNLTLSGINLTSNIVFEGTTTAARGGGLYSLAGNLTISNSQIVGNQSLGVASPLFFGAAYGGGAYVYSGKLVISNSTIQANTAHGGNNSSDGFAAGGGILTAAPMSLLNSTISNNVASGGQGTTDSVGLGGGLDITAGPNSIVNSTFTGNLAVGGNGGTGVGVGEAEGGAINNYGATSISYSTFTSNLAVGGSGGNSGLGNADPFVDYAFGGGIATTEGITALAYTTFKNNQAVGGNNSTAVGSDIIGAGGAEGGALYNEVGATTYVYTSALSGNLAVGGSGNTGTAPVALVGRRDGRRDCVGLWRPPRG